ncbi:hypothetical protein WSM22_29690 [Cytophagales bacterium WSM2-2]|nr:hypothetical protein WSM22_29690 [Cytophagales bacterium WSM2-2]
MTEEEIRMSDVFRDRCKVTYEEFKLINARVPTLEEMLEIVEGAIEYVVNNGLDLIDMEVEIEKIDLESLLSEKP